MTNAMTIRECYSAGFEIGFNSASWVDLPEIGSELPREIDYLPMGPITKESQLDAWRTLVHSSIENSKCYSPFEFTAYAINKRDEIYGEGESENGWDAFERGVDAGINRNRKKRFPLHNKRKWQD